MLLLIFSSRSHIFSGYHMRIALIASLFFVVQAKHLRHRGSFSFEKRNKKTILGPVIDLRGADQLTATIREDELVLNTVPDLSIVAESGTFSEISEEVNFLLLERRICCLLLRRVKDSH